MTRTLRRISYLRSGRLIPRATRGLRAGSVALAPRETMPWHSTGVREELLITVAGRLVVEARPSPRATRRLAMRRGQAVFIPPHTPHTVVNHSRARAMYLYITGR